MREVLMWTAEQRLNVEREAQAGREREVEREEEAREIKRKELEIMREEIEVKRKELDVMMRKMEQDRLLKVYDLDMQVYLADLADCREQKKQWLVANKGWMADIPGGLVDALRAAGATGDGQCRATVGTRRMDMYPARVSQCMKCGHLEARTRHRDDCTRPARDDVTLRSRNRTARWHAVRCRGKSWEEGSW
jgi:hypothetical protein